MHRLGGEAKLGLMEVQGTGNGEHMGEDPPLSLHSPPPHSLGPWPGVHLKVWS